MVEDKNLFFYFADLSPIAQITFYWEWQFLIPHTLCRIWVSSPFDAKKWYFVFGHMLVFGFIMYWLLPFSTYHTWQEFELIIRHHLLIIHIHEHDCVWLRKFSMKKVLVSVVVQDSLEISSSCYCLINFPI